VSRAGIARLLLAGLAALGASLPAVAKDKEVPWPEITAEEKALKAVPGEPGAAAVLLRNTREGRVILRMRSYTNVLAFHWRLKVLTEAGREYSEVSIPADKQFRMRGLQARTIKADGTVVPVAPDQMFEKVLAKGRGVRRSAMVFSFPAVEPGAILEYRYERDSGLIYIEPWQFSSDLVTLFSRVSQLVPADAYYVVLCDKCPNPEPVRTDYNENHMKGRIFSIDMKDVPANHDEVLMPPEREAYPRFEMVLKAWDNTHWDELGRDNQLFIDWNSVARYVDFHYKRAYMLDEQAIGALVATWTQGLTTPEEKQRAVLQHVRKDFRYIDADNVYGSTRSIAQMIQDHSADNEEKAILLAAALRSLGLKPEIALVGARSKGPVYGNFYSLAQFSHGVVAIPGSAPGTRLWLDPTATYAASTGLPWYDAGASALLMHPEGAGGEIVLLPPGGDPPPTRYQVTVTLRPDGQAEADVTADLPGDDAADLRADLVPASEAERRQRLEQWVDRLHTGARLGDVQLKDLEDLDRPLGIHARLELPGFVTRADEILAVSACSVDCVTTNPVSRADRRHAIYVDRGIRTETTTTFRPPAGMAAATPPAAGNAVTTLGRINGTCRSVEGGGLECRRTMALPRQRYAAMDGPELRSLFDKAMAIDATKLLFKPAPAPAPAAAAGK
jgi:hypothetical protein